jgi:hypothetical protein
MPAASTRASKTSGAEERLPSSMLNSGLSVAEAQRERRQVYSAYIIYGVNLANAFTHNALDISCSSGSLAHARKMPCPCQNVLCDQSGTAQATYCTVVDGQVQHWPALHAYVWSTNGTIIGATRKNRGSFKYSKVKSIVPRVLPGWGPTCTCMTTWFFLQTLAKKSSLRSQKQFWRNSSGSIFHVLLQDLYM